MMILLIAAFASGLLALAAGWAAFGFVIGILIASATASLVALIAGFGLAKLRSAPASKPAPVPAPPQPTTRASNDLAQAGN